MTMLVSLTKRLPTEVGRFIACRGSIVATMNILETDITLVENLQHHILTASWRPGAKPQIGILPRPGRLIAILTLLVIGTPYRPIALTLIRITTII